MCLLCKQSMKNLKVHENIYEELDYTIAYAILYSG